MLRLRRLAVVFVGIGVLGLGLSVQALAAGDANQTQCGVQTESSPGFRTYLPDCRAYELVTPPYKGSAPLLDQGSLQPVAVSSDGAHVITSVGGAFAGAGNAWYQQARNGSIDEYELTRTAAGWEPTALTPPATEFSHSGMMAASGEDLGTTLWSAEAGTLDSTKISIFVTAMASFSR